jgi:hypothetical protein
MKHGIEGRWLVLIHRLPPKPSYLRVKIGRLLDRIGSVAVKNAVYVLPRGDEAQEHYQWIVKQIVKEGGEATVFEANFLEGLKDAEVERLFRDERDRDYRDLIKQARGIQSGLLRPTRGVGRTRAASELVRLRRQFDEVVSLDFFGAPGRQAAELLLSGLEHRLRSPQGDGKSKVASACQVRDYQGRTWVTRKDIHVDRMACAWLIRRFIDPGARFRFVHGKTHVPLGGEVRFDMFDGEFTHEGDKCSFEVLVERMQLGDQALRPLAEIIHDIDLKDDKFGRPETRGIETLIRSIAHSHASDVDRIARASAMLDDLYEYLKRSNPKRGRPI